MIMKRLIDQWNRLERPEKKKKTHMANWFLTKIQRQLKRKRLDFLAMVPKQMYINTQQKHES